MTLKRNSNTLYMPVSIGTNGERSQYSSYCSPYVTGCAELMRELPRKDANMYVEMFVHKPLMDQQGYTPEFLIKYTKLIRDMDLPVDLKMDKNGEPFVVNKLQDICYKNEITNRDQGGGYYVFEIGRDFKYTSNYTHSAFGLAATTVIRYLYHTYYIGIPEQALYLREVARKNWSAVRCMTMAHYGASRYETGYYGLVRNPVWYPTKKTQYVDHASKGQSVLNVLYSGYRNYDIYDELRKVAIDSYYDNDSRTLGNWKEIKKKFFDLYNNENFSTIFKFTQNVPKMSANEFLSKVKQIKVNPRKFSLVEEAELYYNIKRNVGDRVTQNF